MATKSTSQKNKKNKVNKSNATKVNKNNKNKDNIVNKTNNVASKKNNIVDNKKKKKDKKKKNKVYIKKYKIDILDVLLIIVFTAIASSFITGYIFNYQYKKNRSINEALLYSESFTKFAKVYEEVKNNYYEEINEEELSEAALNGMLNYLGDKYSIYLNDNDSEELSTSLEGQYKGIGVVCSLGSVIYVYEGSPADKAGIQVNDEIININGIDIIEKNINDIGELIKKDEVNNIEVRRGKDVLTFEVKVDTVVMPSVSSEILTHKKANIGYLKISSFSSNTYSQFNEELKKLEDSGIDSLIIDLRNNIGGYLNTSYDIACVFLKEGDIVYSLESKDGIKIYKDKTKDNKEIKVIVLVNGNTASASEVLAAALKDNYGAIIVGEKTYGKGKVQTVLSYGDSLVKYTSAKWLRPNGECIDEVGIEPDYEVFNSVKGNTIYDNQLEKALDLSVQKEK